MAEAQAAISLAPVVDLVSKQNFEALSDFGKVSSVLTAVDTLNFGSIPAQQQAQLSISVPGARVDDVVAISEPAGISSGIVVAARVGSDDTVNVRALNITVGAIDPPAGLYRVMVFHFA